MIGTPDLYACVVAGFGGLSISSFHSVMLKKDGSVWTTGRNSYGQLSDGSLVGKRNFGQRINGGALSVGTGRHHSFVVMQNGSLLVAGQNSNGELGSAAEQITRFEQVIPDGVQAATAGTWHTLVLKQDGTLWTAGLNDQGQLGLGTPTSYSPFHKVEFDGVVSNGVKAIAAGEYFSLALKRDGSVWATGSNTYGQLGDGTTISRNKIRLTTLSSDVVAISAGREHSIALKQDGSVWGSGRNAKGQLGDGTNADKSSFEVIGPSGVKAIGTGYYFTVVLQRNGTLWGTGGNNQGQLADGTSGEMNDRNFFSIMYLRDVHAVTAGGYSCFILKTNGELWGVGGNKFGQLGDGSNTGRTGFVLVDSFLAPDLGTRSNALEVPRSCTFAKLRKHGNTV